MPSNQIMRFFDYGHLPDNLQKISRPFCSLAVHIDNNFPDGAEKTVCLRKLLEAKDAGVRACLDTLANEVSNADSKS